MRIDLHNHTPLCNHATGKPEEYIKRAIELGIGIYGFSCHAPMNFDEQYRMRETQLTEYLTTLKDLREKYADKIDLRIGLEVDFILGREDLMLESVLNCEVDYLIGSVHFLNEWGFDNPEFLGNYENLDTQKCWEHYLDSIEAMAKSGFFQIIGHFDLFKIFNNQPPQAIYPIIKRALQTIKNHSCVLEINASGLRKPCKQQYPSKEILTMARELDIPITLSSDAHSVENVGFGYEECKNLALELAFDKVCAFKDKQMQVFDIN
ncbi:histidinol-phosphatase HisJ [Helicobacter sp. 23-1048]